MAVSGDDNNPPLGATTTTATKTAVADATSADHGLPGCRSSVSTHDEKSPGVRRVEALAAVLTRWDRVFIFLGIFLVAFAYGLDGVLRYAYQPNATASFSQHSLLATVNVLRSVIAAAAQPTSGRIADIFGRAELVCLSVFFYVLGTIVETVSTNVSTFAAGAIIYQVGYTMIILLVEVIIADITSTRARLFFSYVPAMPFLITTWVSGNVSASVLSVTDWKWGVGMWCIIYPVCATPLIVSLTIVGRRARRQGLMDKYGDDLKGMPWRPFLADLFWRLDVIGIVLMVAVFALILVPMTIAGGFEASWTAPQVLAPLIIGVCTIPVFVLWQLRAPHPLVPFYLMKDRAVWGAMGIALLLNWACFFSVLTGCILGFVVYKVRRLKMFIVAGTCLFMVAFGLLIRYRGDADTSSRAGVIGAQVVLGIAGGMFPYPAQASLQAVLKHENLAVMTGLYLATYNLGSAFGGAVSGAIWTQVLPGQITTRLAGFGNATMTALAYENPFGFAEEYKVDTLERQALIDSYKHAQRLLTITGICLCVPLICFAAVLRNPKLNDEQTLAEDAPPSQAAAAAATDDVGVKKMETASRLPVVVLMIKNRPVGHAISHGTDELVFLCWVDLGRVLKVEHHHCFSDKVVVPGVLVGRLHAQLQHRPHGGLEHAHEGRLAEVPDLLGMQRPALAVEHGDGVPLEGRELLIYPLLVIELGLPSGLELLDDDAGSQPATQPTAMSMKDGSMCKRRTWLCRPPGSTNVAVPEIVLQESRD
ncbi:major facilitator superfamily domain-containing protein [Chaetomidium leptoderma]|uniref:Major facilitator superfamily domain-containing protein n=1 Tax=Chaetomidium leptoderma TaxID=669021 RepID=A0AAN6VQM8_9PEZI|nr:major facilitator superfamily domain-containing protein [Chaetomidium leptoderma]